MSLQPVSTYIVPEQTARVAHAAFTQSSLCMRLYDQRRTQRFSHSRPGLGSRKHSGRMGGSLWATRGRISITGRRWYSVADL